MKLEELQPDATVRGVIHDSLVTVIRVQWNGSEALTLTYRLPSGKTDETVIFRSDEDNYEIVEAGRPWSFDGDGSLFRLVAEARRIRLAYLDYRPLADNEPDINAVLARPECEWISHELEQKARNHAISKVVPGHLDEVRDRRLEWIEKTRAAVKDRLTKEIAYWDHRAAELKEQEQAGKAGARLNSGEARRRADDLQGRLEKRLKELDREAKISPLPPVVVGGLVIVPVGLLSDITGKPLSAAPLPKETQESAAKARAVVMDVERYLGFEPVDRETEKLGYDIESRVPGMGKLRFIEVKGRVSGAPTITVTKNEVLTSLNKPDDFILAMVEFLDDDRHNVKYLRRPFKREPDFGVTSVNYDFAELLERAEEPL